MAVLAMLATGCVQSPVHGEGQADVMLPDPVEVRRAVNHGGSGQALTDAVFEGNVAAVAAMLAADPALRDTHVPPVAYPDFAPDGEFGDLLTFAVARGDAAMLEALLDAGVAPDGAIAGRALDLAIEIDNLGLAERLLQAGARPNPVRPDATHVPLLTAARRGNVEGARLLMRAGADPEWRDSTGTSLLQTAVDMDSMLVAEAMIEAGADPLAVDRHGTAPVQGIYQDLRLTSPVEEQARRRLMARLPRPYP
jgi:hypothetical protein